ncbi:sodium channel protein Nach-like [Malaya genurostris]|uniref:sodium channel protein Nach-like n=1 Tax=Malaya genurostris TaxID=325434 RepID=UPI0026F3CAC8|nr:sodium channel protein Nach-like [Malaya genurostris]
MKIDTYETTFSYTIHSPYDLAISDSKFAEIGETDEIVISYMVQETVSSDLIRSLTVNQRNCIFFDEHHAGHEFYSYNLCLMRCRATRAFKLCRCVPHFYPFIDGPKCKVDDLLCLSKDLRWHEKKFCKCLKPCNEIVYVPVHISKTTWVTEDGLPFKQKSTVRWELLQPKTRFRRRVLFSFEDLLVSFGGGISLFTGKCLLTFAQSMELVLTFMFHKILRLLNLI